LEPRNDGELERGSIARRVRSQHPLLDAITTGKRPESTVILAGYGALIGTLNVVRQNTDLEPETLAKVTEYIAASEAGISAYMQASKGYDPALFTVDGPISTT
jgi:hypothetical protein